MAFPKRPPRPPRPPGTKPRKSNPPPPFVLGGMLDPDGTVKKGRPPGYSSTFDEPCYRMRLLNPSMTNEKLAAFFGIDTKTLYKWTQKHPSFGLAYARGGDAADAEVVAALHHRAVGYTHKSEKFFVVNGVIQREETIEHYAPDVRAAELILSNRQGNTWKIKGAAADEQSTQITVNVIRPKKPLPPKDDDDEDKKD